MKLNSLRKDIIEYLFTYKLDKKWDKASRLFNKNIRHPSLKVELLEPHWRGIYSFRIDKKYRALFFINNNAAEVFKITNHYKK
ncbi:type II toxin-antitoxin system YoeB family toxin [Candidatus Wolfebacteria bacterium]|nr:type II toxin-antitoxin system YoeB family toxin [Candidatus Wolfebacteria bacterium]